MPAIWKSDVETAPWKVEPITTAELWEGLAFDSGSAGAPGRGGWFW